MVAAVMGDRRTPSPCGPWSRFMDRPQCADQSVLVRASETPCLITATYVFRDCSRRRLGHGRLHDEILLGGEGNAQPGGDSDGAETAETQQRDPYCSEVRREQAGDDGWADDQHQ